MRAINILAGAMLATTMSATVGLVSTASGADASWPKEITFALLSTENAAEITRRWTPILAQLEKDLGIKVRTTAATDYRGTIEALKFKKAEMAHLGPKSYVEAATGIGGFVPADDGKYQVIRDLNETAKRLAAQK